MQGLFSFLQLHLASLSHDTAVKLCITRSSCHADVSLRKPTDPPTLPLSFGLIQTYGAFIHSQKRCFTFNLLHVLLQKGWFRVTYGTAGLYCSLRSPARCLARPADAANAFCSLHECYLVLSTFPRRACWKSEKRTDKRSIRHKTVGSLRESTFGNACRAAGLLDRQQTNDPRHRSSDRMN